MSIQFTVHQNADGLVDEVKTGLWIGMQLTRNMAFHLNGITLRMSAIIYHCERVHSTRKQFIIHYVQILTIRECTHRTKKN